MLTVTDTLPPALLAVEATRVNEVLSGPTLIHLPGRRQAPLFISVLLHGNETTGFYAIQKLLRRYADQELPRALSLFIANVAGAGAGLRHLENQPDFNRIWAGGDRPEHAMARQVLQAMRPLAPFAAVDVHNNTGLNPYYACVSRLDNRYLHLASLFSRIVVYSIRPHTTLARAFAEFCPAVILECGQPGAEHGVDHVMDYLEGCLHLSEFPDHPVPHQDIELMQTLAIVKVPEQISFGFGDCDREICFSPRLDHLNFRELPVGAPIARINGAHRTPPLHVTDQEGVLVTERFFTLSDGEIRTTRPVIPAMLTLQERIIRQDCLCYLMERMPPS